MPNGYLPQKGVYDHRSPGMQSKLRYLTSSKISCRSCTPSRAGGAWNGSLSQVIRSRYTNNCCRNNATRLDKLQAKVLLSCRYFTSNMAISAAPGRVLFTRRRFEHG